MTTDRGKNFKNYQRDVIQRFLMELDAGVRAKVEKQLSAVRVIHEHTYEDKREVIFYSQGLVFPKTFPKALRCEPLAEFPLELCAATLTRDEVKSQRVEIWFVKGIFNMIEFIRVREYDHFSEWDCTIGAEFQKLARFHNEAANSRAQSG